MGRSRREYPEGKLRLKYPKDKYNPQKEYTLYYEYTWLDDNPIRKDTGLRVKVDDWNPKGTTCKGGELRISYGGNYKQRNTMLADTLKKYNALLHEYSIKHPHQMTSEIIHSILFDAPLTRNDEGKDFVEYVKESLQSKYTRGKIGKSRYENGLFSLTVTDASDMLYFMHNGCAVEDFLLDRHSYDVILFDNYKDYYDEYPCQTDTTYKDKPHRSNVPGVIVYMVAYGPPTINANVPEDTTLTRLTDEMIEKNLKYEKKSNPRRSTAYGPAVDDGEEETVIELIPSKRELRRAARRAGK